MDHVSHRVTSKLSSLIRFCAFVAMGLASACAVAASKLPDVIALLSEAKAKAEGRASRAQACLSKKDPKLLVAFVSQYDDARNPFNGRIDGWVVELRVQRGKTIEASLEVERLNQALNRIDAFAEATDRALTKHGCRVYKKVNLGIVAKRIFEAKMIDELLESFKSSSSTDKEREEAIRAIEVQKILEWQNVRSIIVFDWKSAEFFVARNITPEVLAKGSTSVYVNEWALAYKPKDKLVLNKSLPLGLSSSYQLYTGDLDDLERDTGRIK